MLGVHKLFERTQNCFAIFRRSTLALASLPPIRHMNKYLEQFQEEKIEVVDPAKRRFQIASNSPVFVDSSGNAKIDHKIASISRKYRSFL